jgi:hypothetical protein
MKDKGDKGTRRQGDKEAFQSKIQNLKSKIRAFPHYSLLTTHSMKLILALDFGGTKHAAAIAASGQKQWLGYNKAFSPPNANAQSDLEIMFSLARELLADRQPTAIGVSFGGPVDAASGIVRLSHHVSGWEAWLVASGWTII